MDRDVRLIWTNAQTYHGQGNRFAQMAEEVYRVRHDDEWNEMGKWIRINDNDNDNDNDNTIYV